MDDSESNSRTCGWKSTFPEFCDAQPSEVRESLQSFVYDPGPEQIQSWRSTIPLLQKETQQVIEQIAHARGFSTILEYQLPLEERRPDVVVLLGGPVVVIEMKGKIWPSQADLDQVSAYARDLRCYHRECAERPVKAVLVPTRATSEVEDADGVIIAGPHSLDSVLTELSVDTGPPLSTNRFLAHDAYQPLPTLVEAARELFESRTLREIWRARAATDPAVEEISRIAHKAAADGTRHLVLITGVPGSGKTLVGLRSVHAKFLDDLAVERSGGPPTAPGVFLSGNGPLVQVLQYQLKDAGGAGKTFVRGVKEYLESHVPRQDKIPDQHLLVFDEAQRAFSALAVEDKHKKWPAGMAQSEPAHFIELCERIPEWSVMVGLIGGGQEIHKGEEEGLQQWVTALQTCGNPGAWKVHCPDNAREVFEGSALQVNYSDALNLDTEIRFHLATDLHQFVQGVLDGGITERELQKLSDKLHRPDPATPGGIRLWITRSLEDARSYLWERYSEDPNARFGLVASSKDKVLERQFGIPNGFQATKRVQLGPWYTERQETPHSCRRLEQVVTEFGAQGLELDMALLAWGTDFIRDGGRWSIEGAGGYRGRVRVKDPHQLRVNAYRVLLTRGRDGTMVFVPPLQELDETWDYLVSCGFRELDPEPK